MPKLNYFSASEFGIWWPLMSNDLLKKLDLFREKWGDVVEVSRAPGAIGREGDNRSQHNPILWGEVRAVDVFPKKNGQYITSVADRQRAYDIAREVGFTGIGIYTDTQPGNMLHLDVRSDRTAENPALWSRIDSEYLGIADVIS
ncbi:hypothetical protein [Teredinibacter turnerae]|uniref:hypothetical protein n=1 Tax=Teredinibacter turnerae TaxID=2426 RepID=UPI000374AF4B|nr:hypothetical protein [Teredinibacter turnerae]